MDNSRSRFDCLFVSGSLYYLDLDKVCRLVPQRLNRSGQFLAIETHGDNRLMGILRRVRSLVRKDRDVQSLTRLLGDRQLDQLKTAFPIHRATFFDCLTLAGVVLKPLPSQVGEAYQRRAAVADTVLLNRLGMRSFAFKWMFEGQVASN